MDRKEHAFDDIKTEVLAVVAEEIVEDQKDIAPVKTGYLRDHIMTYQDEEQRQVIESEADYSIFLEYGTSRMEPQPFFWPPILSKIRRITDLAVETFEKA